MVRMMLFLFIFLQCGGISQSFTPHRLPRVSTRLDYVRINENDNIDDGSKTSSATAAPKKLLLPRIGDVCRYTDLDGGKADGEVRMGKIVYIQKTGKKNDSSDDSPYLVELEALDDTGDGYYVEYTSRRKKLDLRNLATVSPVAASWVGTEQAYKIPRDVAGQPLVQAVAYDWREYAGPSAAAVDQSVVQADAILYGNLKGRVLKLAALAGLVGTVVADLVRNTEDAVIYGAGAVASLAYLFLLSVKTDTIASPNAKFGSGVANLRFVMPLLVLVGIALYNVSQGDANPVLGRGTFDYVTSEQFAAAILGFLTYRIPLFVVQLQAAFAGDEASEGQGQVSMPGSAGIAMKLLGKGSTKTADKEDASLSVVAEKTTVLLVSGPQATGRSELVDQFLSSTDDDGLFVIPTGIDRMKDPATFERMDQRGEFLAVRDERFGLTKECFGITDEESTDKVMIVDADVELAKKLTTVPNLRLVGVWVGLRSVDEFEKRLEYEIESGKIPIPEDETKESLIRSRVKEIVKEIEFGISSGIFEFTILNTGDESCVQQLRDASTYCF